MTELHLRTIDVREALSVFYRRRRLAVLVVLCTLLGTYAANYLLYPVYQSSVKILVERAAGSDIPFAREQIAFKKTEITETQCELLRSTAVLEEVVRELHLDTRPLPSISMRDRVYGTARRFRDRFTAIKTGAKQWVMSRLFHKTYTPPPAPDPSRQAVADLGEHLSVEPIPNTDLIAVTVSDYDPEMASRIANSLATTYLHRDLQAQRERARLVYDLIDHEVNSLKPSYEVALRAVENFERAHHARLLTEQIRSKIQEISSLELTHAELTETQVSKLTTLRMELSRLQQTYEPNHPKVLAAQSELAEAERRLKSATTRPGAGKDADTAYADLLQERIARAKQELAQLSLLDGEYSRLQRHKDQEEELYLSLKKKREEAQVAEATRSAGTRIVDSAAPALHPVSPRGTLNMILALLGGGFLAAALAALLEFLDRSVKTPLDVARASGVETVWSVPDWSGWTRRLTRRSS